jgi:hypothetical protein
MIGCKTPVMFILPTAVISPISHLLFDLDQPTPRFAMREFCFTFPLVTARL